MDNTAKKQDYLKVSLNQGPCFGTCPVYEMEIQNNGTASYLGKQYAPYKNMHSGKVLADTMKAFNKQVSEIIRKADQLPRKLKSNISDVAHSTMTIYTKTDSLRFMGSTEFAPEIAKLRQMLFSIAESTAWAKAKDAEPVPPSQLLVTLQAADQIQLVTEEYYMQQMKVVNMTSKKPPIFLLKFDPYTMTAKEMVKSLKRHHAVVDVQIVEEE